MSVFKGRGYFLSSALLIMGAATSAFGQSQGSIIGTVTDPSGAVVPNASVTVADEETGQAYHVQTNDSGHYLLPSLNVGHYDIKVEAPGFQTQQKTGVNVTVANRLRIDFQEQVGNTGTTVEVQADAIRVQSDSSEVSEAVTGQQITQLATNGRNITNLAELMPGAASDTPSFNGPSAQGSSASISFNGQRPDHNIWMLDGGEIYDRGSGGKPVVMPSVDAIGEFRALTSNYSAEYGLGSGGTLTMVIKSGAKQFHGGAWEFFRNDALDANNFFSNKAGSPVPELRYNVFGFNIGGPVILPHYNKDRNKTFFFYNQEWRRLVTGGTYNTPVPSAAMLNGNFSAIKTPLAIPTTCQLGAAEQARFTAAGLTPSPCTGPKNYFPGNIIPTGLISPAAQAAIATGLFPVQNSGTAGSPSFFGGSKQPTNVGEQIVRIDHSFADKFQVFGHLIADQASQTYGTPTWGSDTYPTVGSLFKEPSYSAVVHATYSISPTLVSETAFNYDGTPITITPTGIYKRPSSFNPPELFAGNNDNRLPALYFQSGLGGGYDVNDYPWTNSANDYQWREDLSLVKGAHSLKFGGQYMRFAKTQTIGGDTQGNFGFNGSYTGYDFADFLLGYANSYQESAIQDQGSWADNTFAFYFQDNWRVNSRLTLNLGLRWEGLPHTYEVNNRLSNFYPNMYDPAAAAVFLSPGTNSNVISPNSPGLAIGQGLLSNTPLYLNGMSITGQNGAPQGIVNNHWNNWGPRVGFAYDVTGSGSTILRGGFGIMYERVQGNDVYNMGGNVPFGQNPTVSGVYLNDPAISVQTGSAAVAPILPPSITAESQTNYKLPTSYQWSLGLQRQVASRIVASVTYVGNVNRHQSEAVDINDLYPTAANLSQRTSVINSSLNVDQLRPYLGYSSILTYQNAANSHYNALQAELRMQATAGLSLQVGYTYSRSFDTTNSGIGGGGDLSTVSNPFNRNYDYGPSSYDLPQVFFADYVYELPFFAHASNGFVKSALGGWELSGVVTVESGFPHNVTMSGNTLGIGGNYTNRPNVVSPVTYNQGSSNWAEYFSTASFAAPTLGSWGDVSKNFIRGPGRQNWDISLFKSFALPREGSQFQLRFETFNTFNHTQFNGLNTNYGNSQFGQLTGTYDPRTIQLGAKLLF